MKHTPEEGSSKGNNLQAFLFISIFVVLIGALIVYEMYFVKA